MSGRLRSRAVVVSLLVAGAVAACSPGSVQVPGCSGGQRLALVAQSVPTASYLPCVDALPAGWSADSFEVDDDGTRFDLRSDRAEEPVEVALSESCRRGGASPIEPLDEGIRSYLRLDSISPTYAGTFFDVFVGGCVTTRFAFERGPHISLVDELRRSVVLQPRRELAQDLEQDLGVTLDP